MGNSPSAVVSKHCEWKEKRRLAVNADRLAREALAAAVAPSVASVVAAAVTPAVMSTLRPAVVRAVSSAFVATVAPAVVAALCDSIAPLVASLVAQAAAVAVNPVDAVPTVAAALEAHVAATVAITLAEAVAAWVAASEQLEATQYPADVEPPVETLTTAALNAALPAARKSAVAATQLVAAAAIRAACLCAHHAQLKAAGCSITEQLLRDYNMVTRELHDQIMQVAGFVGSAATGLLVFLTLDVVLAKTAARLTKSVAALLLLFSILVALALMFVLIMDHGNIQLPVHDGPAGRLRQRTRYAYAALGAAYAILQCGVFALVAETFLLMLTPD
jgi:hypothetical protein